MNKNTNTLNKLNLDFKFQQNSKQKYSAPSRSPLYLMIIAKLQRLLFIRSKSNVG